MYSIHSLKFGVLSPEKIRAMSLCEVVTDELYESNRPKYGGLRDPRFGVSSRRGICPTCQKTWSDCSGHFGHFELPCPCFHIGWMYEVLQWLRKTCVHCGHVSNFVNKKKCIKCNGQPSRYFKKNSTTICVETPNEGIRTLLAPEAYQILSKIKVPEGEMHPSALVLTVLPIPPNCVRPSPTLDGEEVRGEDDITRRLLYVIRIAKAYKKAANEISVVKAHAVTRLQDALHMYIDQTRMSTKVKNTQKSISERLRGKTGRIRGTLMGKRCNFTSRTVITGDAMLDMREVGVPKQVAETLTIVEHINRLNFEQMKRMIREKDSRIKYVIRKDGTRLDLKTMRGQVDLQVGCSVERQLKDGDLVLFNRQPSLHRMSIMCHRAKIMSEGKTFRLNLTCTTPYNADFDGDEMNLHALQTHESRADALELMSVAKNIITPQANRPVMGIVQDTLLSCYLMTQPGVLLGNAEMCNMAMWIDDFETLPTPVEPDKWTGLQCISMLFPKDFVWKDTILNGKLLKGPIGKKALGRSHGSIIHRLYNDYGPDRTCRFINELQRINHIWLSTQGFSIGIGDMRISAATAKAVRKACANVDQQAAALRKEHAEQAEPKINRMLNQTRDSMGLIAKNAMHPDNCLGRMVSSGSKGSMVNILQIMACVGQQNCQGKRIQPTLGHRTLPMFKPFDDSPRARGFVKHSYIDGLTPDEYWNHTVGGREGLVDTAVKTSATGYIQRRLVKSLESIHVANDTSVRDSQNRVIQFLYGEDGIDGMCHEMVVCPFENLVEPPSDKNWPELTTAWNQYHFFKPYQLGEKWAVPLPCQRLLNKYASKPVASPEETRRIVTPLLNIVKLNQLYHIYALATLTQHQCNGESLQKVVDILTKKWYRSIVAPGEMVGTIAAQSVGEPTTQMTLNTFHQAGNSAKNVTLGLPRLEELINASSKMKTPVLTVHADTILRPENAWRLKTEIQKTTLKDILLSHSFELNEEVLKEYLKLPDNKRWNLKKMPKKVLNCTIDRKKMIQSGLNIYEVVRALRENAKNMYYAYSDNAVGEITLMARPKKEASFYQYVKSLMGTTIKGSSKIPSVSIRTEGGEFVIDTEGIDLRHIHSIRAIEQKRIQCNDIWAIKNTYGIEAARAALLNEIHSVVSFDGSYVNIRHLMVIVDWMTWAGGITALNRHGVKKMMDGATPIKRATFEQPVEILHNAAVKGLCDELSGVSEQLLVGKMPVCGSHFNGAVVEKEYQTLWDEDDWKPEESEDEDLFGEWSGADTWRPKPSDWESHTTFASSEPAVVEQQPTVPAWQQPTVPAWQQQQQPTVPAWQQQQQPTVPAWQQQQQPTVPAWQQPTVPAWQQPTLPAWQQQQQPTVPAWQQPTVPAYSPASPAYSPASPAYSPASPAYSPASPEYSPTSPTVSPVSPAYSPASPAYSPASPAYSPASPAYSPASPAYSPASPAYSPASPAYSPSSPTGSPVSPAYSPEGYRSSVDEESPKRHKKISVVYASKRTGLSTDDESSTKRQKRI
jgi:DNA-directed RNA polymerase II subunit RPB1